MGCPDHQGTVRVIDFQFHIIFHLFSFILKESGDVEKYREQDYAANGQHINGRPFAWGYMWEATTDVTLYSNAQD